MVAFDFVPMRVLPTCLFAGATYWMVGLRASLPRCATFLALLVLTNLTGASMNIAIGMDTKNLYCRGNLHERRREHGSWPNMGYVTVTVHARCSTLNAAPGR